jgi:hypothetical protein
LRGQDENKQQHRNNVLDSGRQYTGLSSQTAVARKHLTLRMVSVAVTLLLAVIYGRAQSTSGTILGNLTEQSGAVVTNTPVTLTNI